MDNLTHSLVGVLLSRAGLNKLSPKSAWLLVMAANVPDIDIVALVAGPSVYFEHHRGLTHAVAAIPGMALLPVLLIRFAWRQKLSWWKAWIASSVAVGSHLLLDWTNAYGIHLWLPFSNSRPALHATHVVDLFIWVALAVAVFAPFLSRLVSSEIGGKSSTGRGWAIAGLLFVLLYDTGRTFLRDRAIATQEARMFGGAGGGPEGGREPRRSYVFPTPINPLVWQGIVETEAFWALHDINLLTNFDPGASRILYKAESSPAIQAAANTHVFQVFRHFSPTLQYTVSPEEDGQLTRVEARDLRFGFRAIALLDANMQAQRSWFEY